jgi:predicted GNAT family acetyltransferase
MDILQKQNGSKGSFYVQPGEEILAEMIYSMTGDSLMIINHTEVSDELRGKNVGYQLVKKAADYAREHQIKIIPLCPFAKSVFDKKKDEFKDVLRGS